MQHTCTAHMHSTHSIYSQTGLFSATACTAWCMLQTARRPGVILIEHTCCLLYMMHIHIHAHTHTQIHKHMHIHKHTYHTQIHKYAHTQGLLLVFNPRSQTRSTHKTHLHKHTYKHTSTHKNTPPQTHTKTHLHVYHSFEEAMCITFSYTPIPIPITGACWTIHKHIPCILCGGGGACIRGSVWTAVSVHL